MPNPIKKVPTQPCSVSYWILRTKTILYKTLKYSLAIGSGSQQTECEIRRRHRWWYSHNVLVRYYYNKTHSGLVFSFLVGSAELDPFHFHLNTIVYDLYAFMHIQIHRCSGFHLICSNRIEFLRHTLGCLIVGPTKRKSAHSNQFDLIKVSLYLLNRMEILKEKK